MSARGEFNIGQLCRDRFGEAVYSIGFGTFAGTVAAASQWDGPMEVKQVRPALAQSYEALFHDANCGAQWTLPLRHQHVRGVLDLLSAPRLERAIGVVYRPQSELQSHYFQALLPAQFDEYVWFDQTRAVSALDTEALHGLPETYPFGV
jgi:protein-L-isoaspartate(D-aspartate) O-methyltransferase